MSELDRIVAFEQAIQNRSATRTVPSELGVGLFNDLLPRVWSLNLLRLDGAEGITAERVVREADRLQSGLAHRRVETDDEASGAGLGPRLRALGWDVETDLVMIHRRDPDRPGRASVREHEAAALEPAWRDGISAEGAPWAEPESIRQLVEAMRLKVATARARFFAAEEDGVLASHCSLYSDGEIGQIESVLTLPFFRGRGLARAVVLHALAESRAAGHELTFLVAEEDDWPKELYERLGFETIGRRYEFSCPPAPGAQERTRPASPVA